MRGGVRPGAGRKEGYRKPEGVRIARTTRAYDDEWELLKELGKYIKKVGVDQARAEFFASTMEHYQDERAGESMKLDDVMTTGEAAELWGKNPTTIKHLCTGIAGKWGPKLTSAECRKSSSAWLVTRAAMERLYGPMPAKETE